MNSRRIRRGLVLFTTCILIIVPAVIPAQDNRTTPKTPESSGFDTSPAGESSCRLLIIDSDNGEPYNSFRRAMLERFYERGCGDGRAPRIQHYTIDNRPGLARRIWEMEQPRRYDAIIVQGTVAAEQISELTADNPQLPIFYGNVTDPIDLGLIEAFNEPPSRNFTGISYLVDVRERLRLARTLAPDARNIGLVHTTMPQSLSYNRRLREALGEQEFSDLSLHTREVPYVRGTGGILRSISLARRHVRELDSKVDVFLSPNDLMGVHDAFVRMVAEEGSVPLIGINEYTTGGPYGAVASLYPSTEAAGRRLADMVMRFLAGDDFSTIHPVEPEAHTKISPERATHFNLEFTEE